MSLSDKILEILETTKNFYFEQPLLLPYELGEDEATAYNLIFRRNEIPLIIENNFLKFHNLYHPQEMRVTLRQSGLVKELLEKLFCGYLILKNDYDDDSFAVTSSYSKISEATDEELLKIANVLKADINSVRTFVDTFYVSYELKFKDTDLYTIRLVKNLRDYAVQQDGGLWRASILEFPLKSDVKNLTSLFDESVEEFLKRFIDNTIKNLQKENEIHLNIVNDNDMLIDVLKR